jgi:competence protein ComEC
MTACLILLALIGVAVYLGKDRLIKELRPSGLEQQTASGDELSVTGTVYRIEASGNYQILYLKNNSIKNNSINNNSIDNNAINNNAINNNTIDNNSINNNTINNNTINNNSAQNSSFQESKLIVYISIESDIHIGNVIRTEGEIELCQNARNPGNFDQKQYYQKENIHGILWGEQLTVLDDSRDTIRDVLYRFRQKWEANLLEVLGEKDGAILGAMMLGEKRTMDSDLKELYQVNGISHVLAISGLHLSFIGVGVYRLLRRITGSYPVGGVIGMAFLMLYILMIGLTVSAVRALVMFLFRVGADITGRHYDAPTALSVAAVIVLLWRPLYLYDGGFWMSFGAILAILLVLPLMEQYAVSSRIPVLQSICATLSIDIILLPIQLYYFYEFPIYSIVLNVFVIPLMSVLLAIGILGSLMYLAFPMAANLVFYICRGILWIYEHSCELALYLPGARIVPGQPKVWQMGIYYGILLVWMMYMRCGRKKKMQLKYLLIFLCVETVILAVHPERWGRVSVTVLDVGQGDGIFIRSPGGLTCLVDGGSSDINQVGRYRIESYLKSQGVGTLDYVFVTHGDSDHMSGIEEMLERQKVGVSIENLVLPVRELWDDDLQELAESAAESGVHVATIASEQWIEDAGMVITCLQPGAEDELEAGNEASMVLAVQYGNFDMLLTGDVEGTGEELLIEKLQKNYADTSWEVLKVAHHGSKNSSGEELLSLVQPKYALISAGIDNQYGHPHQETLTRLEDVGSVIYTTQESGALMLEAEADAMRITTNVP